MKEQALKKDDFIVLKIEDQSDDGFGIGHDEKSGEAVFVKDTVMGDVAEVKIIKAKKNYAFGRMMKLKEASPYRTEPVCENAKVCGGCTLQYMDYQAQLEMKQKKVLNCVKRLGGIEDAESRIEPICGMDEPYFYRNKMQFPVGRNKEGQCVLGFYAGKTHSIIPLTACAIGHPVNRQIIAAVKRYVDQCGVSVYDEASHRGILRHVLTRIGFTTGELMVCLVANGRKLPKSDVLIELLESAVNKFNHEAGQSLILKSVVCNINEEKTNRILGFETVTIHGQDTIEDCIGNVRFKISAQSFFQVNPAQTVKLYQKVLDFAGLTGEETVWDMYCGIGTISLFLAQKAKKVFGVEIVPQAIDDANQNAKLNGIENAEFFVGKAEEVVPNIYKNNLPGANADVVVVDPPRKGCDEKLLDTLALMSPKRLVYVSCNPATLGRDLKVLTAKGFSVEKIAAFDQFPQSTHVESCVLLERVSKRKPDVKIRVDVNLEDYYRIKDNKQSKEL